jgi:antitoxin component YwqK of YwqJK toxin-antitoxin module
MLAPFMQKTISFILILFSYSANGQVDTIWKKQSESQQVGSIYKEGILLHDFHLTYKEYSYFSPDSSERIILYEKPTIVNDSVVRSIGTLSGIDFFRNGEIRTYYESGQIKEIINYDRGLLDGKFRLYFPNGKLAVKGQYFKHARIGKWSVWNLEGKVLLNTEYFGQIIVAWLYPKDLKTYYFSEGYTQITSEEKIQEFIRTYCPTGICDLTWMSK